MKKPNHLARPHRQSWTEDFRTAPMLIGLVFGVGIAIALSFL